jgi:WD40 repeat protein
MREMLTIGDNQAEMVADCFADSGVAITFQAETSSPNITPPEGKGKYLGLSKQFRCRNVYPYDKNGNNSLSNIRAIVRNGDASTSEFSLIPTWNSRFAYRLQQLKKTENNESSVDDEDRDVLRTINNIVANRALPSFSSGDTHKDKKDDKEECDDARREEHQGRDQHKTNRKGNRGANPPESRVLMKKSIEVSDYPFGDKSLIPSGRDRFARKLQRLKTASSKDSKILLQQDNLKINDDDNDSSIANSMEDEIKELSKEETEASQIVIPKIPAPIIMEIIGSYVNDRKVWNSLASLNRETFAISKNLAQLYRPWPRIRWRATTTNAQGGPGQVLLRGQRRRRRNARGAVQTSARPRTVAFGKDYLCCGTDRGDVLLRRVHGDGSTRVRQGHLGCINSVKCCGNWLISVGDDLETRIWNVTTMSCEAILGDHVESITSIAILSFDRCSYGGSDRHRNHNAWNRLSSSSSCMLVATAGLDGDVHLYAVHCEGNKVVRTKHVATFAEEIHPKPIHSIVLYEKDGRRSLISGGLDGRLRLWDVDAAIVGGNGSCYKVEEAETDRNAAATRIYSSICIYRYDGEIKSIAISRDKERIAASFGRNICYSALSDKTLRSDDFLHHYDHNHRRGRRLEQQRRVRNQGNNNREEGISVNGTNTIHDTEDDHWKVLNGHYGDIRCVDFAPDGRTIASACTDGSIRLWKLGEGTWERKWKAHNGFMVCSLAFSPDGQSLLSAGSDGTIAIEGLFS